jgi:hypothetical protein
VKLHEGVMLVTFLNGWELERSRMVLLLAADVEATAQAQADTDLKRLKLTITLVSVLIRRLYRSFMLASTNVLCAARDGLCARRAPKQVKRSCKPPALSTKRSSVFVAARCKADCTEPKSKGALHSNSNRRPPGGHFSTLHKWIIAFCISFWVCSGRPCDGQGMRCTSEQPGVKAAPHFRRILALLPASQAQLEATIKMLPLYYGLPCTHLIGQLPLNM